MSANVRAVNDVVDYLCDVVGISTPCTQVLAHGAVGDLTFSALKTAYRQCFMQVHPDKGGQHNPRAKEAFQVLSRAMDIINIWALLESVDQTIAPGLVVPDFVLYNMLPTEWEEQQEHLDEANDVNDAEEEHYAQKARDDAAKFREEVARDAEADRRFEEEEKEDAREAEAARVAEKARQEEARKVDDDAAGAAAHGADDDDDDMQGPRVAENPKKAKRRGRAVQEPGPEGETQEDRTKRLAKLRRLKHKVTCGANAKAQVKDEKEAEASWIPRGHVGVEPAVVGLRLNSRWQAHEHARRTAAHLGLHKGIKVHLEVGRVTAKCGTCSTATVYTRRTTGHFVLIKVPVHLEVCFGALVVEGVGEDAEERASKSSYTAAQLAQGFRADYQDNPNLRGKDTKVQAAQRGIFMKMPASHYFLSVREQVRTHADQSRAVQMAALPFLVPLYEACDHKVRIRSCDGKEMKKTRIEAAEFIYLQCQKAGKIDKSLKFDKGMVDVSDIDDVKDYYAGCQIVFSTAPLLMGWGNTFSTDACHMEGLGTQSFGGLFNAVGYDTARNIHVAAYMHDAGNESMETWTRMFDMLVGVPGFGRLGSVVIADLEKGLDAAFDKCVKNAPKFGDAGHVKKALKTHVAASEKAKTLHLYDRVLREPCRMKAMELYDEFVPGAKAWLDKFPKQCLLTAFTDLKQGIITPQGTESQNSADLKSGLRAVEPQCFLQKAFARVQKRFRAAQRAAKKCKEVLPPRIMEDIAALVLKAATYVPHVKWVDELTMMECTMPSGRDSSVLRKVTMQGPGVPPKCCKWTSRYPCYHGAAAVISKHGAHQLWRYCDPRCRTTAWKAQLADFEFNLPLQADIDAVMLEARARRAGRVPGGAVGYRAAAWASAWAVASSKVYRRNGVLCSHAAISFRRQRRRLAPPRFLRARPGRPQAGHALRPLRSHWSQPQ
ncbi:hypothetical protein M885DRAFT_541094 [Pelagophyceae sp. CCMP2097]|nr:hypothetical protein M885DRAFT_541094 [Pelagophyceae sp. CCMP2097]